MESKFPRDFTNFELEITNRCNLACPRCSRTEVKELFPKYWRDSDLDLMHFAAFIEPILESIRIFEFKGTRGDPIFHPSFLEWMSWCKSKHKQINIHTNGQAGQQLWSKLSNILEPNDQVTLGIDGMPQDFMKYRINAKWKNIEQCVQQLAGKVHLVWQYIIFSYNEHEIEEANKLSQSMGFNEFLVIESDRWSLDGNDWLKPSKMSHPRKVVQPNIDPHCQQRPMHIVTADGYYMPCCYLIDDRVRYKTPWAKTFDIRHCTMDDVIKSSLSQEFFARLTDEAAPNYCRFECGKCDGK